MAFDVEIKIHPQDFKAASIGELLRKHAGISADGYSKIELIKKSLDARKGQLKLHLKVRIWKKTEIASADLEVIVAKPLLPNKSCHIIGFGPAGLFAALQCLAKGIKPIVIERGKMVDDRVHDIGLIHRKGIINPESNYCFGEGGAGTYSDGKLYTRSTKRGNVKQVLDTFIYHGALPEIGIEAHPHIGTNRLPKIIATMRKYIIAHGGEIHFNAQVVDLKINKANIESLRLKDGAEMPVQQIILATGHSARDIFELLHAKGVALEAKPFALGVRIEHDQSFIDQQQYHLKSDRPDYLPPASYSLVTQACGKGVFSFCMCPGGVIAAAATQPNEIVVNGWSGSSRNGKFANSGFVAEVNATDWQKYEQFGPLAALKYQQDVEQRAFAITQSQWAPAQLVPDFLRNRVSTKLPRTSYHPGLISCDLNQILPNAISKSLKDALSQFNKKMPGYASNNAILVGIESRTSSPVRIPRDKQTFRHPQLKNLLPCGEGAGYAGGIVSAALDGIACANAL